MTDDEVIDKINQITKTLRGNVIHVFVIIENFVIDIIIHESFKSRDDFFKYTDILLNGEMPFRMKKDLLKMCLEKHKDKLDLKIDDVLEKLRVLTKLRDSMAHYNVEFSNESIELFKKEQKIILHSYNLKRQNYNLTIDENFDKTSISGLLEMVETLANIKNKLNIP